MNNKPPDPLENRLKTLEGKLNAREKEKRETDVVKPDRTGWAVAMKMSSEFIASTLVGAAFGWGIDVLLGTSPWGMIFMLMLGFAAGVKNVMRSANEMANSPNGDKADEDSGSHS